MGQKTKPLSLNKNNKKFNQPVTPHAVEVIIVKIHCIHQNGLNVIIVECGC